MGKRASQRLDAVFGALSDPIRRTILARLAHGESSVTTLSEPFDVSAPAITKHLRVLESSGLITRRKEGRVNYCCLNGALLREADDWIQQQRAFWEPDNPDVHFDSGSASKRRGKESLARRRKRKS